MTPEQLATRLNVPLHEIEERAEDKQTHMTFTIPLDDGRVVCLLESEFHYFGWKAPTPPTTVLWGESNVTRANEKPAAARPRIGRKEHQGLVAAAVEGKERVKVLELVQLPELQQFGNTKIVASLTALGWRTRGAGTDIHWVREQRRVSIRRGKVA